MIEGKRVLGIIPARSGSKGLPNKNIRELCGKPLIAWSIEKALKSKYIDEVLVSTNCPQISEIAKKNGASVPFIRPAELATDQASTYDVIRHALQFYASTGAGMFDYVVLLEPTSPLREDDDIDRMLDCLDKHATEFDSIVSIGQVSEHPAIMKRIVNASIESYCTDLHHATRRQDNPPAYFPYGVAYIAKTPVLLAENSFYTKRCMGFPIKRYQNYEIDDIYDFICVEGVMRFEWRLS